MMNPTLVHMSNHSATEDAIATANGYPLSSNGWATLEPRAGYDNRVAMMMAPQVVQGHSLQTNVGLLHYSSMTPFPFCFPPPRERSFYSNCLSLQVFAHWPSAAAITEQYHVPFNPDPPYPEPVPHEFGSYSNFDSDRDVHVSQGHNAGANHGTNYDHFWMGSYSPPSESDAGSVSPRVLPEQRATMNGTPPASSTPPAWQRGTYVCGSDGDFYVCEEADGAPSAQFKGATVAHTFPSPFSLGGMTAVAQSPASTPPQYHPSHSQDPPSISQGRAHQYHAPRSEPMGPVPPNQRGVLCSAERSEQRTIQSRKASPCNVAGQEKPIRTLRSVRTRSGDVYAEHEQGTDQIDGIGSSGRWVCQCGSTFVRDSDWERHAMHSLSHSAGGGFDCNLCDISFTRSDAMFRHRRKKHGIKSAPCRVPRDSEDEASQPFPARGRPATRSSSSMGKY